MTEGAHAVHSELKNELENYIKSQYLGKTPVLLDAVGNKLDEQGVLYQEPYIESSPAYKSVTDGLQTMDLPEWLRAYFSDLSLAGLGVFSSPFVHQIQALENAYKGKDVFVSTGTGSGKTECFMWPILGKLISEARNEPESWKARGVRVLVMYPMNALVSDQISRLRRMIGDEEGRFVSIFRKYSDQMTRRPQFGMYTGRTPYPGQKPSHKHDNEVAKTLSDMLNEKTSNPTYYHELKEQGRIPAKVDLDKFIKQLQDDNHIPDSEDAELFTRFEMQRYCPDILITNYSMLEYMLMRPQEADIWNKTAARLKLNPKEKLLFIIDEAHMYRGSSGGEVSLLLDRLFYRLGIDRSRVQFILTTASMPDRTPEDRSSVHRFARALTSAKNDDFVYLTGEKERVNGRAKVQIPFERYRKFDIDRFENADAAKVEILNDFFHGLAGYPGFNSDEDITAWMYDHLLDFIPFEKLLESCRGQAVSLSELTRTIFPDQGQEEGMRAVSVMLAVAPIARQKGKVLFPARMHMLFRGISGIYACTNPECPHGKKEGGISLGQVFLNDGSLTCPTCGSSVYELYMDRRCGALFYGCTVIWTVSPHWICWIGEKAEQWLSNWILVNSGMISNG